MAKHIAENLKYEQEREDEKEVGERRVPQAKTRLKPFLERFGARQIGTLTPADLEKFKKDLAFYPVNAPNLRHATGLTFDEVVSRSRRKLLLDNDEKIAECITEATLDRYVTVATNFLKSALPNKSEQLQKPPSVVLRLLNTTIKPLAKHGAPERAPCLNGLRISERPRVTLRNTA